ncbi:hypothetical protein [Pontibacter chitinilyticus]|uniref:hypothetical protein n=1 Tax=Pontibacter chitinilyticus TaxID=2674989 RepID=UPI003218FA7F
MRKYVLLILFLALIGQAFAGETARYKLDSLRLQYQEASKNEEVANAFYKLMSTYQGHDPLVLSYQAASEAVMAKYVWNPYSRLKHLKTASAIFERAVKLDNTHPEIRFLRFTVEHYVPRYLNLSGHVAEDKQIVLSSLQAYPNSVLSPGLAKTIRDFMLSKDHCTEAEKVALRSVQI